jgi:LuxR family maltose regulon positive regulatory protein
MPLARQASQLSAREREVLQLVAQGLSSKGIGQRLALSPSTVNQHIKSIFNKLGVDTRAQAVSVATQRGFI